MLSQGSDIWWRNSSYAKSGTGAETSTNHLPNTSWNSGWQSRMIQFVSRNIMGQKTSMASNNLSDSVFALEGKKKFGTVKPSASQMRSQVVGKYMAKYRCKYRS